MKLLQMLGWREPADGSAPALEALATGVTPQALDGMAAVSTGRRERDVNDGSAVIQDALSVKLMHGWLQNRHQTLMPLTLNVGMLSTERRAALARILASFLLVGRPPLETADFAPTLRSWLGSVGGDVDTQIVYDRALSSPLPLNEAFDIAQNMDLTIYAYVAALMASDTRYPVSVMLCDMVQARFDLPSAVVRSAVRRFRR